MSTVVPMTPPSASPTAPTFDFGPEFETRVSALILRDERFAKESTEFVKPEHFNNAVERNLVAIAQEFCKSYSTPPSIGTLIDLITKDKRVEAAERSIYADKIRFVLSLDLKEREYIRSKVVEFCRNQAMLIAAVKIPELLKKGKVEEIQSVVNKAASIGTDNTLQFIDFFAETAKRKDRREAILTGKVVPGVSTGFQEIDEQLYRKGWGRGELSVVMAPSKRGKTALMMQSGICSSMNAKKNWLYISLEVDEDILSDRADASVTGTSMSDLLDLRDQVAAKVSALGVHVGKFWIERRPANSCTTDQIEQIIEGYFNAGHHLDAVVVDYIGIIRLKPSDDRFVGLGNAGKELRRIAGKFDIAMITGAQTNRDAVGKQVSGMDSIGESFAIVQDCDLLLSVNANEAEMAAGVRRIFFAASRNNPEVTIKVQGDLDVMQMIQTVISVDH